MHAYRRIARTSALFLVFACGCASMPSRFYSLSPIKHPQTPENESSQTDYILVAVGPVTIPDSMDKPQIVTRSGRNKVVVNEFDRWSGSLQDDISRVLIENLASSLPIDRFRVVPWAPSIQTHLHIAYRITIDVMRIELSPVEPVSLRAQWTVVNQETNHLVTVRDINIVEPAGGGDFEAMVATFSGALATLSREIAGTIKDGLSGD